MGEIMKGRINFGNKEIIDIKKIRITDYSLKYQDLKTIKKFNSYIDKKYEWGIGSAELLYRINLLSYKTQFVTFCCRNHYKVIYDTAEQHRYKIWLENQPTKEDELQLNQPKTYGDATMRHSE
jgi:hypothetical protein